MIMQLTTTGLVLILMTFTSICAQETTPLINIPHSQPVTGVNFSPDGTKILSGSYDHYVRLWDAVTGDVITSFTGHTWLVYSTAYSRDNTYIVSTSADRHAKVWNASTGTLIHDLVGHGEEVICCAISPDSTKVVTGGGNADKSIIVWDSTNGNQIARFYGHSGYIGDLQFSRDGSMLVSCGSDGAQTIIRRTSDWQIVRTLTGTYADFSLDGTLLYSSQTNGSVNVYDIETGNIQFTIPNASGPIVISPHGNQLMTGNQLRDAWSGSMLTSFIATVIRSDFSPEGSRILTAGDGVQVWNNPFAEEEVPVELSFFTID